MGFDSDDDVSHECAVCGGEGLFQCLICLKKGCHWGATFCSPECYREHFKQHKCDANRYRRPVTNAREMM